MAPKSSSSRGDRSSLRIPSIVLGVVCVVAAVVLNRGASPGETKEKTMEEDYGLGLYSSDVMATPLLKRARRKLPREVGTRKPFVTDARPAHPFGAKKQQTTERHAKRAAPPLRRTQPQQLAHSARKCRYVFNLGGASPHPVLYCGEAPPVRRHVVHCVRSRTTPLCGDQEDTHDSSSKGDDDKGLLSRAAKALADIISTTPEKDGHEHMWLGVGGLLVGGFAVGWVVGFCLLDTEPALERHNTRERQVFVLACGLCGAVVGGFAAAFLVRLAPARVAGMGRFYFDISARIIAHSFVPETH